MFIRMFLYADNAIQSLEKCKSLLRKLSWFMLDNEILSNTEYWKIRGIYVIELNVRIMEDQIKKENIIIFLKSLANVWEMYGEPAEEILISRTMEGCTYIHDDIEMINIIFDRPFSMSS